MKDKFLILLILISLSACSQAKTELESNAYLEAGISILRNEEIKEKDRYLQAKEKFELALEADPKNKTAQDLHNMISKLELLK